MDKRSSKTSNGTPGWSLAQRITKEVFTLATFSADVNSSVKNIWNEDKSGATHFKTKSTSPFNM